jgi:hypothetical protein
MHWHARAKVSPARWLWMLHARILWMKFEQPFAFRDVSAVNFAPFLPFNRPCTKCRRDGLLP